MPLETDPYRRFQQLSREQEEARQARHWRNGLIAVIAGVVGLALLGANYWLDLPFLNAVGVGLAVVGGVVVAYYMNSHEETNR